jgi:acylphosphatase
MTTIAKHLTIRGRVQGVGFRQFMLRAAHDLHVTGWVRNRADGSVEAIVAGTSDAVHMMLERARRGPSHASITHFEVTEAHERFERFDTLPTV